MQKAYKQGYSIAEIYLPQLFLLSGVMYVRGYFASHPDTVILLEDNIDEAIALFRLSLQYYFSNAKHLFSLDENPEGG